MSKTEIRNIVALLVVIAMIVAIAPMLVFPAGVGAVDNSSVTATFTANNGGPIVNSVALYDHSNNPDPTMSPLVEYVIKVNVTDNNTLDDLSTVTVWLYYDADGLYSWPSLTDTDNNTAAKFTWTYPNTFTLDAGMTGSTWVHNHGVTPTLTASNGVFEFHFTPGKVAQESADSGAEWHIYVIANDGTANGTGYQEAYEMNWYGEISGVTASVGFGNVALGTSNNISTAPISATYTANGAYYEEVKASTPWSGSGYDISLHTADLTPAAGTFVLQADDDGTVSGAMQVLSASYATIDNLGAMTTEDGVTDADNYLWLTLPSSGIPSVGYTGTIYFKITNNY